MEQVGTLIGFMLSLGKVLIALILPVMVGNIGNLLLHQLPPKDFFAIPIFTSLARTVGLMIGLLVLHASFDPSHYSLEELFMPSSPWNLSFGQFLFDHANPFNYTLFTATSIPAWRLLLIATIIVLQAIIVILALHIWPRPTAFLSIGACAGIIALTTWSVVYLVSLTLWSLHVLNFWVFAVLGFYYHYRTSH